jgi:Mrp family chromosome partitioning ATPase
VSSLSTFDVEADTAFESILHSVFRRPESEQGIVIGFTSANPGTGVSYISWKIAALLSAGRPESTLCLRSRGLRRIGEHSASSGMVSVENDTHVTAVRKWDDWHDKVAQLRSKYRYSIIDCPSLSEARDVLNLAPHLDGIVVVIAANETRKEQIVKAERQIQMASGTILGFVLNKRRYPVPNWIYKLL